MSIAETRPGGHARRRCMVRGVWVMALLAPGAGCAVVQRAATPTERDDVVFYCDGAGGGGPLTDWGASVREGLLRDGYEGEFRSFRWQTGLGVLADHATSAAYKRGKARELVGYMKQHWRRFPGGSVHLIGLSAGSAIAVFAVEELPRGNQVDNVILLGSSLSADYDLRRALARMRGEMYVFSSTRDRVLQLFVPIAGSADRHLTGTRVAGRYGFQLPPDADDRTEVLYSKIVHIEWDEDRAGAGDPGTHTGTTNPRFVQQYIAPLINRDGPRHLTIRPARDE
ncbi:MAG TPA: hypothetical protein PKC49_04255 [Phycisphaerae bacterium]|nr:hypothetical protein [Phycisphaerae bacterium]